MNKTRKNLKGKNYKKGCLNALNSKKFKNGLKRNLGITVNVKKLKKINYLEGVIIGKAIYDGTINLHKLQKINY